jgi:hypothetical protein
VPDVGVAVATPTSATGALGRGGLDDRGSEQVLQFVLGERPVVGAGQAGQQPERERSHRWPLLSARWSLTSKITNYGWSTRWAPVPKGSQSDPLRLQGQHL